MEYTKLKEYFPLARTRAEVLKEIRQKLHLKEVYDAWNIEQQEGFLTYCTGISGRKVLYDSFFKEVMSPESAPERLEDFLSQLLQRKVSVLKVLPNDSTRLADEASLLILDVVVELEDGSIANIEMQQSGYDFPGQRAACYSADSLLRQYKQARSVRKKKFSWSDIHTVYTIVLFGTSPKAFQKYPDFKPLYEDVYEMCRNTERMMGMYSKELAEIDRNTVRYMIRQRDEEIKEQKAALEEKDAALEEKDARIAELERLLAAKNE